MVNPTRTYIGDIWHRPLTLKAILVFIFSIQALTFKWLLSLFYVEVHLQHT